MEALEVERRHSRECEGVRARDTNDDDETIEGAE